MTARLLDAETRLPLEGVSVVALWQASDADDAEWIASRRRAHDEFPDVPMGATVSEEDGVVDLETRTPFCHDVTRAFGLVIEESGAAYPGYGVGGIVAEKPGYRRLVVETPRARWTKVEPADWDGPRAVLHLGDLLLARE